MAIGEPLEKQTTVAIDRLRAGQEQIESAIGVMLSVRGMKLDVPLSWHKDSDGEIFTLEAFIGGQRCEWRLVREAVEDYLSDLEVRRLVDRNVKTYFIPR